MAKQTYKVKCTNIQLNPQRSNVQFAIGIETAPPAKAGEAPRQVAKDVFNLSFAEDEKAAQFKLNKEYTITIEG